MVWVRDDVELHAFDVNSVVYLKRVLPKYNWSVPTWFPFEGLYKALTSAALACMVLGAAAIIGLMTKKGRLTGIAGGVGIVAILGFVLLTTRNGLKIGLGVVFALLGSVFALLAGLVSTHSQS